MTRLPTSLEKLTAIQSKLDQEAALLRKRRDQLARQQARLEKAAHNEALRNAGAVVQKLGIALDDLDTLELILTCGLEIYRGGKDIGVSVGAEHPHDAMQLDGQVQNRKIGFGEEGNEPA